MYLHEYQTKECLREVGIPVPDFAVVTSLDAVWEKVENEGWMEAVVKAQVHAGGRGKAGGVKLARSREEIVAYAQEILGMRLITPQTGEEGVVVGKLLLSKAVSIAREFYVALTIDRKRGIPILLVSAEGGVEIEEVAAKSPEKILTIPIHHKGKLRGYQQSCVANKLGWKGKTAQQGAEILQKLVRLFLEKEATLLEINPLVETEAGDLTAIDAKAMIDDNALFRQPEIAALEDRSFLSQEEEQARVYDLAYVKMEGNIGCLVNGAGLAMATMDLIDNYGGKPANFLDVGGGASQEKVAEGFKILMADPDVQAIFINIFGGILNCVTLAAGILTAVGEQELLIPLVVRMEGTNVEEGKKILADSGMNILTFDTLEEAAEHVVLAAKGVI